MAEKRWIVGIDWVDGSVEDTSEVLVYAESAAAAKARALTRWRKTNGAAIKVQRVFFVTKKLIERWCY